MGMWTLPSEATSAERFSGEEMSAFIETLAGKLVKRGLAMPAGFALEMMKPVSFIGSQAFFVFIPLLEMMVEATQLEKLSALFSQRTQVERLQQRIEALSQQNDQGGLT